MMYAAKLFGWFLLIALLLSIALGCVLFSSIAFEMRAPNILILTPIGIASVCAGGVSWCILKALGQR